MRRALIVVLVAATVIAWAQVGRTTAAGQSSLDLVVVALPVLAIMMTVLVLVALLGWTARFAGRHSERLPVEGYIAARRLAGESVAVRLVGGSLGLGIGLLVFAVAITTTLDRMVDVKLATTVGGVSSARLIDDLPADLEPPAPTTVIRSSDTRLTPGSAAARIVAIDPATYADAVSWSDEFGAGVDEVLDALAGPIDDSIPVVAIEGENVPPEGAFGLTRAYPYRVVATVRGFPTAGDRRASVMASADAITDFAARQNDDPEAPSPIDAFRSTAVSQATAPALTEWLSASDVRYRDVVSQADVRESASIVAPRSAFAYLAVIGVTAAAAAAVAMALFLSARRRNSALAGVLTRSMGLPAWRGDDLGDRDRRGAARCCRCRPHRRAGRGGTPGAPIRPRTRPAARGVRRRRLGAARRRSRRRRHDRVGHGLVVGIRSESPPGRFGGARCRLNPCCAANSS